jgi:molecular chaperone DnaK (HSP70)
VTVNPQTATTEFSRVIPRNHKLPASRTEQFSPIFADQQSVTIKVIEGDDREMVDHPDNVVLTSFTVDLPESEDTEADRSFDVTFDYDVDGILHVSVHNPRTDELMAEHEVSFGITEDKRALVRMAKRVHATLETGELANGAAGAEPDDPEVAILLQRAYAKVIPFLDSGDASRVRAVADRLRDAGLNERAAAKEELQTALAPYPYLF